MRSHLLLLLSLSICPGFGVETEREPGQELSRKVGDVVRRGEHYEVHVHFDNERAADLALEMVEAAWPITMEILGIEASEIEFPLEIHLYASKQDYIAVESKLTNGAFRDSESFAHWNTRTAHVAMAPPLPVAAAEATILTSQTREVLAHEAAHLAVYSVIPTYRWHPTWFAEGLAMTVELEVARQLGLVERAADHPRASTYQVRAQRLFENGRVPSMKNLFVDSVDSLRFHEKYALWHELFRVLREGPNAKRFEELVRELRHLGGGPGMRQRMADFIDGTYGFERIAKQLEKNVAKLEPEWDEVFRSLETIGDDWLQTAFPDGNAIAWRTEHVDKKKYSLSGRLVFLGGAPQMNVLLDRSPRGFVSVAIRGDGTTTLFHYHANENRWERMALADTHPIRVGEEVPFRVDVEQGTISVMFDGKVCIDAVEIDGRDWTGPWGLGVQSTGAGFWRGVALSK